MSQSSQSILDTEPYFSVIKQQIEDGDTNCGIARLLQRDYDLPTSESSIKRFRKRHGLQIPGTEKAGIRQKGDDLEGTTEVKQGPPVLDDPDKMLRDRGLNPEDWFIDAITVNEWDGPKSGGNKVTYYQAKFTAKRRKAVELQIFQPGTDGWKAPNYGKRAPAPKGLIVVVGDQQAPFHDKDLHTLFLKWLKVNEPKQGVSLGDSVDFPDISRHRLDPENTATVNECLQEGYNLFRDYVDASPLTFWRKLIGNHDERIRNILLDKPSVRPLYDIQRPITADGGGEKLLNLGHAMALDDLGIEIIDPHGQYDLAQLNLTDKLAVRHGWVARKGSGASALATLEHLGYSVIVGHTHRQSVVHDTKHEIDGKIRTITGVESGCMCRVDQTPDPIDGRIWPSYTPAPDWQQGFATVEIWDDGYFNIDTAKYVNGTLMWRDQKYTL